MVTVSSDSQHQENDTIAAATVISVNIAFRARTLRWPTRHDTSQLLALCTVNSASISPSTRALESVVLRGYSACSDVVTAIQSRSTRKALPIMEE